MDKKINPDSAAGDHRRSPSPPNFFSFGSLTDTRQMLLPSSHGAQALLLTHHVITGTVTPATVLTNAMQFSGDHRFPPGRPPINSKEISRPDQTTAINTAFAAWVDQTPEEGPADSAASLEALRTLLHAPHAAAKPIGPTFMEPLAELDPSSAVCDPSSFLDPEYEVYMIDREDPPATPHKNRMLPKRGMQRRLNGPRAGFLFDESPVSQALVPVTPGGRCHSVQVDPGVAQVDFVAPPPQVTPLRSIPESAAQVLTRPLHRVDCYYRQRQPETGALLPEADVDGRRPYVTPGAVKHLDLLLNGQATVDHRESWLQTQMGNIIWMWTTTTSLEGIELMPQVGSLEPPQQVIAGRGTSTAARRLLPRLCDVVCDVASGGNQAGDWGAGVEGGVLDVEVNAVAQEGFAGEADRWPELTTAASMAERQVSTATAAEVSQATIPSMCSAGQTLPRTQRRRPPQNEAYAPPALATAEPDRVDPRDTQRHTLLRVPCSGDSVPGETPKPQEGASAPGPIDRAPLRSPHRRRRGSRRKRKISPLPPPPLCRPWWEGGGDNSRGAQTSLPSNMQERSAMEEAGSGLPQLPLEEDTTAALRTAPDRGSTVPVLEPGTARPPGRKVPAKGKTVAFAQGRVGSSEGGAGYSGVTLSQRREFLGTADSGTGSTAAPLESLWAPTRSGRKSRQAVAGAASALACVGLMGAVSARFPMPAARRYYGPASPAGRRGRRGHRRRHNKEGHGDTRATGRGDMAEVERAEYRAGAQILQRISETGTGSQVEGAEHGRAVAYLSAAGDRNGTVRPSVVREPSPRSGDSLRSGLGLAARWKRREGTTALVSGPPGEGLDADVGSVVAVMGTRNAEDAPRTAGMPAPADEQKLVPPAPLSVPDTVETWLMGGGRRLPLELRLSDWSTIQDLGWGSFPDLVAAFAWRRCRDPSLGRDHGRLPTIQLVSYAALDIPKDSWPTSWEGLVEHVEKGGYFRTVAAMRGGMDPAAAQQQLGLLDFTGHLDWDNIDHCLARVRTGGVIPPDEVTESMTLAQLLSGCVALQQWDHLAAFLETQPPEVKAGLIISPARLAALSVIAARPRPEPESPPQWLLSAPYAELRFNHLSLSDFVPDPHRANDLRGQILDGIVDRILSVAPEIKTHPHYRLQDLRSDVRPELNLKDLQMDTCLFSAIVVLPTGPWISDFYKGVRSLGGRSFCTIVPTDLHIETELSNTDQRVLRAIRIALGVDNTAFRLILDESLGKALRSDARSRDDTVRFTSTGGRGSKRTMEHVSPDSPDSRLLVNMDATSLLLARRTVMRMPLRLGPVTVSVTLPPCPQQALRSALLPREPAAIRQRLPGTVIDCPVILIGPLPKGSLPAETVHSGARMAGLRRHMHDVCRNELQTKDVRLVGRYDKDRSPMYLYMEFGTADAAQLFGSVIDRQIPPEFCNILTSLCGEKASQVQVWSCNLLAECLAVADEKQFKAMMSHGQTHPCPLPPPPPPPHPPPPGHAAGQAIDGTGSAAGGPDNPANV